MAGDGCPRTSSAPGEATTIRKALITSFGPSTNIAVTTGTIPPPPKNHVQVRVLYSGFSGADINMRLGRYPLQPPAPLTPGYCFSGHVTANGPGASLFPPGTAVTTITVTDSEAELVNVDEKYLVAVPPQLAASDEGMQQAAAAVFDWNTAYGMVHHAAKVSQGQRVFIHGLSGAVGHALSVFCQQAGAEVYGTASLRNHERLVASGARPFVYSDKKWMEAMRSMGGAHAVFDPLGFESWDESYDVLARDGILVGYGGNKGAFEGGDSDKSPWPQIAKLMARGLKVWQSKRTNFYYIDRTRASFKPDAEAVLRMIVEGKARVPIKKIWEMTEESLREAHESYGKTEGIGSVLVRVGIWKQ